jgi:hypothetical protein
MDKPFRRTIATAFGTVVALWQQELARRREFQLMWLLTTVTGFDCQITPSTGGRESQPILLPSLTHQNFPVHAGGAVELDRYDRKCEFLILTKKGIHD